MMNRIRWYGIAGLIAAPLMTGALAGAGELASAVAEGRANVNLR